MSWRAFGLVTLKVILGSFGVFTISKPRKKNTTSSTNRSRNLLNFCLIIFTKLNLGFLKFWKLEFSNGNFQSEWKFQNTTPTNCCQKFSMSWIFLLILAQKLLWESFEIFSFWFLTRVFFSKNSNSPLYPMWKRKTSIIWQTSDRRAKRGESWDS